MYVQGVLGRLRAYNPLRRAPASSASREVLRLLLFQADALSAKPMLLALTAEHLTLWQACLSHDAPLAPHLPVWLASCQAKAQDQPNDPRINRKAAGSSLQDWVNRLAIMHSQCSSMTLSALLDSRANACWLACACTA